MLENKILKQVQNDTYTGCGACYNACPVDAIAMQGDKYGFYKPIIDKVKRINCDLFEKIYKLFITDLYNSMCFAFIFNKPFDYILNPKTGSTFYDSDFKTLDIKSIFNVNYAKINQTIEK